MTLYRFTCAAAGDLLMFDTVAEPLLELMGKPRASAGVLPAASLPLAIQAVERAVAAEPVTARNVGMPDKAEVSFLQRAWPLLDMLKRALAADVPVLWRA